VKHLLANSPRRKERGIALILVLWASAVLALLLAQMVGDTRVTSHAARLRLDTTRAELAAQGGIAIAIAGLSAQGRQRWAADGRTYRMPMWHSSGGAPDIANADPAIHLAIQAWSERGKVDVNTSDALTLRRLFICAGGDPTQASQLANTIQAARRSRGGTLMQTPDALQQVSGMPETLFEAVSDAITVWSGSPKPASELASPLALCAGSARSMPDATANVRQHWQHWQHAADALDDPGPVIDIVSEAQLSNGVKARLSAVVMLHSGDDTTTSSLPSSSAPYTILDWHES